MVDDSIYIIIGYFSFLTLMVTILISSIIIKISLARDIKKEDQIKRENIRAKRKSNTDMEEEKWILL